jgi:hypothetical protein
LADDFFNRSAVKAGMTSTHTLETPEVDIAYDVRGPLPTADGRPPLFMIGQPWTPRLRHAGVALPDRTVVTTTRAASAAAPARTAGSTIRPTGPGEDVHAVIEALGAGPVEMFASSGAR